MHLGIRILLFVLIACAPAAMPAAQSAPAKILTGEQPGDKLGEALAAVPDATGDGRPEILVGVFRADKPQSPTSIADAGAAYLLDGATFKRLYTFWGEKTDARLGYAVAGVPDVDGDGAGDLLLGSPRYYGVGDWSGRVYVYSGKTGGLIYTLDGDAATAQFGFAVAGLEDLDGDGRGEILVGAYGRNGTAGKDAGRAYLYSGKTGQLLKEWEGEGANHFFGVSVAGVPDADGDGKMDILIGASEWGTQPEERRGRAYLYSGATRSLIRSHDGATVGDLFGWAVSGVPDTDGDGRGDLLVGARDFDPGTLHNAGRIYLLSGKDGTLLHTFDGEQSGDNLGRNVAGVPDLDDDGRGDVILPANRGDGKAGIDTGIVYVHSGATGKLLFRYEGEAANDYLGWGVAGAGDVNGDGRGEVLIGAYQHGELNRFECGRAYIHTQGLTADVQWLSARLGGTVNLSLDAGAGNKLRPYLVVASFAGSEPGLRLPRVHLPVSFDNLFVASYFLANSVLFNQTLGVLDASGKARAWVKVPPGLLTGFENGSITLAYALVDRVDMASNPVTIGILP
jgi:hypothetical protein